MNRTAEFRRVAARRSPLCRRDRRTAARAGAGDDPGLWHVADNADLSLGSGYAAGGDANPNASPDGAG